MAAFLLIFTFMFIYCILVELFVTARPVLS